MKDGAVMTNNKHQADISKPLGLCNLTQQTTLDYNDIPVWLLSSPWLWWMALQSIQELDSGKAYRYDQC